MRVHWPGFAFLAVFGCLPGWAQGVSLSELRDVQAALVKARADYAQHATALSEAEATDYAAFIAQLSERLASGCVAYTRNGTALPEDIDCPESLSARVSPADINHAEEKTRAESIGILDAELEAGLGEFDERLLREQERVKAAARRTASGGEPGSGGGGEGDSAQQTDVAGSATAAEGDSQGAETETTAAGGGSQGAGAQTTSGGASRTDSAAGPPGKTVASGSPADMPDGSDDDVVARQLREAAEKETDPELKKKLWEEYRKYKQGTQ